MLDLWLLRASPARLSQSDFSIKLFFGKRGGRPTGARLAQRTVEDPIFHSVNRISPPISTRQSPASGFAIIPTSIARVGNVDAIVDSAAQCSIITADLAQDLVLEEPRSSERLVTFDRQRSVTLGIVRLTVRFKESVVELHRVRVVPVSVHQVILGLDWMNATQAIMQFTPNGPSVVLPAERVPDPPSPHLELASGAPRMNRTAGDETVFATGITEVANQSTPRRVHFSNESSEWETEEEDMSIGSIQVEEYSDQNMPVRAADRVLLPPATLSLSVFKSSQSLEIIG